MLTRFAPGPWASPLVGLSPAGRTIKLCIYLPYIDTLPSLSLLFICHKESERGKKKLEAGDERRMVGVSNISVC